MLILQNGMFIVDRLDKLKLFFNQKTNKIKIILAIGLLLTVGCDNSIQQCGTIITKEQLKYIENYQVQINSFDKYETRGIIDLPIQIHIVQKTNGTGGISLSVVESAIDNLNTYYINANIRFVALERINYINSDTHYYFDTNNEESLSRIHDVADVINLYIPYEINSDSTQLCGYAYYPPSADRIIISKPCMANGSTLPHEVGHYFMLYHTHGISNGGKTDELVNGENCYNAGDYVCDTPADPNLQEGAARNCSYTGEAKDANGDIYRPDPTNMMSYSSKACRSRFTKGQYARINYAALYHRNYLTFPPKEVVSPDNPYPSAISGELAIQVDDKKVNATLNHNLLSISDPVDSTASIQLTLANQESVYIYVFGLDSTHTSELFFPLDGQSAFFKKGEEQVTITLSSKMVKKIPQSDEAHFCVLYAKRPLELENIFENIKNTEGTLIQRIYQTMVEDIVPENLINYTVAETLSFSASAHNRSVVPLVVALKQK